MSSCPKECGPRGDVIPTLGTEEPADLAPKAHYSCLKPAAKPDAEEEVVGTENVTTGGKSAEQELAVNENKPCESPKQEAESENTKPEEEDEVEEDKAAEDDDGGRQKRKEIEHSSLFNIADATSDHRMKIIPDAHRDPITSDIEKLVQGAKIRSLKLSPNKSPRGEALQQATSQGLYDDNDDRASA